MALSLSEGVGGGGKWHLLGVVHTYQFKVELMWGFKVKVLIKSIL